MDARRRGVLLDPVIVTVYTLKMDKNRAIELYRSGLSIRRVAELVGSNRESVRKLLVKNGSIRGNVDYHDGWEVRIERNIETDPNSGCWLWTGSVNNMGYGSLSVNGKRMLAHRAMYGLKRGQWFPSSLDLCHKCDTPACVNPDHLFPGTRSDNMRDAHRKGRRKSG